jgi:hypothetical protein
MNTVLRVIGVLAVALGIIGAVIHGGGDRQLLTPPPEAAVEGFVREVVSGRYANATPYLSDRLSERVSEAELRAARKSLEARFGKIEDVRGDEGRMQADRASALAALKTYRSGWRSLRFGLVYREGVWKIDALPAEMLPAAASSERGTAR